MKSYGFVKLAVSNFNACVGDVELNCREIVSDIKKANERGVKVLAFPRLALCGGIENDLLFNTGYLDKIDEAFAQIVNASKQREVVLVIGHPVRQKDNLFDCMVFVYDGKVVGISVNTDSVCERYFSTNYDEGVVNFCNFSCPFESDLFLDAHNLNALIAIDFSKNSRNTAFLSENGANLVIAPLAQPNLCSTANIIRTNSMSVSYLNNIIYAYVGSAKNQTSSGYLQNSSSVVTELGDVLGFSYNLNEGGFLECLVDIDLVNAKRRKDKTHLRNDEISIVEVEVQNNLSSFNRAFSKQPFVDKAEKNAETIFDIMENGLFNRVNFVSANKIVLGVSGGLDSTLALLVIKNMCKKFDFPLENVVCVTMAGLGTGERTANNAQKLIKQLGFEIVDIPIKKAVLEHFEDISHDGSFDIAYENAQARERTQILMDIANMNGGIMVGTSDMSEEALGFSTFGGDAISMYNILSGVPKTVVKALVRHYAKTAKSELSVTLLDIADTVISPELKPNQSTEDYIGSYLLHDFFLYHLIGNGFSKEKVLFLAEQTFDEFSKSEIREKLEIFIKRFVNAQFKRNTSPDSVQIFDVYLSQFNFVMQSDVYYSAFDELRN